MIKAQEAQNMVQNSKANAITSIKNALCEREDKFNEEITKAANTGKEYVYLPFYVKYNNNFYKETADTICKFFFSYGYVVERIIKKDNIAEIESILICWEAKENE